MCAGTPCLVIISRSDPLNSQTSYNFHSLHILAADEEQAERIAGLRLKWSLPSVMAVCNIVLHKKDLAVWVLMALVRHQQPTGHVHIHVHHLCLYKNLPLLSYTGSAEVKEEAHLIYPGLNSPQDSKYILTRRGRRTVAMETHSPGSCGGEDELL
ncbi:hypothetical protein GOODEAATRI_022503 [Goodea atripinnis]|uniref:Uncharacterized protein n=1 Tax=Goodea atripinnis TaxID=208336 RepID=A0ABV0PQT7_9TELE